MEEEHTKMESFGVALRKESVDRNTLKVIGLFRNIVSLSARRAWIEIPLMWPWSPLNNVALRKESVDRNILQPM